MEWISENNLLCKVNLNVTLDILLDSFRYLISMCASKLSERDTENARLLLKIAVLGQEKNKMIEHKTQWIAVIVAILAAIIAMIRAVTIKIN
ncbi:hypothetical protein AGMMS50222_06440 [Endomicrobiia bacterium]|nr:hypothetical protein AGMMS49531_07530 [Endomicrobiia bacterium]GHT66242.1 hypothetical protein AGMMS49556_07000 [Endomicrobiia bacterium]GHT71096.1 hypothetical protein AGMMS49950_07160 [Endomicrobiia bacterium]GHT75452.1 hypothetical protein AGMMS50222_06440 [Endomicrobiia bacterium]